MNFGISAWGPIGDGVIDSPSGLNTYMHWIILEAAKYGQVYWLQKNLDEGNFKLDAFYTEERREAYKYLTQKNRQLKQGEFPELDVIYMEWRFPINGRNTVEAMQSLQEVDKNGFQEIKDNPNFQTDLVTQGLILHYYLTKTNCKISILDQDYKMTEQDELYLKELVKIGKKNGFKSKVEIFDYAYQPKELVFKRKRVFTPMNLEKMKENGLKNLRYNYNPEGGNDAQLDRNVVLSYIGNNYERNDVIKDYLEDVSNEFNGMVHFYGNWEKYGNSKMYALHQDYPFTKNIVFHPRITKQGMEHVYGLSLAVPLLSKKDYMKNGFTTQRIIEVINSGSIAIGLRGQLGIETLVQEELIANKGKSLTKIVKKLMKQTKEERIETYLKQFDLFYKNKKLFTIEGFFSSIAK